MSDYLETTWSEGYLTSLICAGVEKIINVLRGNSNPPMPFQRFLDQTGLFFDRYILDISRQENLSYVGGRMTLQLDYGKHEASDMLPIRLSAELYFQTVDKQWVVKQKQGQEDSTRFTDWDTDETAAALQQAGKLEWSIEPFII